MFPPKFDYVCPQTLAEALSLLATYGDDAKVLAGGLSLISVLKYRLAHPKCLIDLGRLPDLNFIREESDSGAGRIAIGAMTTYAQIKESPLLQRHCPILPQTVTVVGDVQVRNRGTIGGSLAHADPAGDSPATILAVRAELKAVGPKGERWIKAENFFTGLMETALEPNEILTEIRVPKLDGIKTSYLKAARRPSDFALVGVAVCLKSDKNQVCQEIAIGITGVSDKAYRADAVEKKLIGKKLDPKTITEAAAAATEGVEEVAGNIHASPAFRTELARVYVSRAIQQAS